jgi:transcriptional regulator with XRE-family HTH domain
MHDGLLALQAVGLTQADVASLFRVTQACVSQWLHGSRRMAPEVEADVWAAVALARHYAGQGLDARARLFATWRPLHYLTATGEVQGWQVFEIPPERQAAYEEVLHRAGQGFGWSDEIARFERTEAQKALAALGEAPDPAAVERVRKLAAFIAWRAAEELEWTARRSMGGERD